MHTQQQLRVQTASNTVFPVVLVYGTHVSTIVSRVDKQFRRGSVDHCTLAVSIASWSQVKHNRLVAHTVRLRDKLTHFC